jgi:hypothetical protein
MYNVTLCITKYTYIFLSRKFHKQFNEKYIFWIKLFIIFILLGRILIKY